MVSFKIGDKVYAKHHNPRTRVPGIVMAYYEDTALWVSFLPGTASLFQSDEIELASTSVTFKIGDMVCRKNTALPPLVGHIVGFEGRDSVWISYPDGGAGKLMLDQIRLTEPTVYVKSLRGRLEKLRDDVVAILKEVP